MTYPVTAYDEGRMAFLMNKDAIDNPYPAYSNMYCEAHMQWDKGYRVEANDFGVHLSYVNSQHSLRKGG